MVPRARKMAIALVGVGAAVLAASYFRTPKHPVHAIDAVPPDAFVAIEVNVGALRKSGALAALFGESDEQSLTQICGFDPVDQMDDLVFTVPEDGSGAFGVAVQATLSMGQLVDCANKVVTAHGGDPTADITKRGDYSIITPRSTSSDPGKPGRSLGYKAGSPVLVGPKSWLYSMVDAVEDAAAGNGSPGEHLTMRGALAKGITPPPTFLLTASAVLERSVREKLKAEMIKEVGTGNDSGTAMMLGVLGMTSGVLGLYETGGDVRALVQLHCEHETECAQVERLVLRVKEEWSQMSPLRNFGLGPVLERVHAMHSGTTLEVSTSAPTADVVRWAKLIIASRPVLAPADFTSGHPQPSPGASASTPAAAASNVAVPTQTIHVQVPEGVAPGQAFTVKIPAPVGASSVAGSKVITATIPAPSPSPP
jgi:hypothetical protein